MNTRTAVRVLTRMVPLATPGKLFSVWKVSRLRAGKGNDMQKAKRLIRVHSESTRKVFANNRSNRRKAMYVVIPCQNEAEHLPSLLVALARNSNVVPIVVNNNSTDSTSEVARAMGAIVIDQPTGRKMAATQRGIAYVRKTFEAKRILFTDGDSLPVSSWAETMDRRLRQSDHGTGAAVFGTAIYAFGRSRIVDVALTVLGLMYEAMREARGETPIARGHNYGISFDNKGKIVSVLQSLDPNTFAGVKKQLPDDAQILQSLESVGAALHFAHDAKSWIVTANDRFRSMREVMSLMRYGVSYDDVTIKSYQKEYDNKQVRD